MESKGTDIHSPLNWVGGRLGQAEMPLVSTLEQQGHSKIRHSNAQAPLLKGAARFMGSEYQQWKKDFLERVWEILG